MSVKIVRIGGHPYQLTMAPAGKALRLLRGWTKFEAAQHDAVAVDFATKREAAIAKMRAANGVGGDLAEAYAQTLDALADQEQRQRLEAASFRSMAAHLLTEEAIEELIVPTLGYAIALDGKEQRALADIWEVRFAGDVRSLLDLLLEIRDHNFSDFFGASTDSADVEAMQEVAAPPTSETEAPTGGSGRPSARASVVSSKSGSGGR